MVVRMRKNAHVRQHVQEEEVKEQEAPSCWVAEEASCKVQAQPLHSAKPVFCLPGLFLSKLFEGVDGRSGYVIGDSSPAKANCRCRHC